MPTKLASHFSEPAPYHEEPAEPAEPAHFRTPAQPPIVTGRRIELVDLCCTHFVKHIQTDAYSYNKPARLVHTPYLKLACLFLPLALARSALDQEAMGKGNTGFTRRVAGNHPTRVKKTSAGGAPEAADPSLASLTAISFSFIEHVLMPPYLNALRRRNAEVQGTAMWEALDEDAGKW